VAIIECIVSGQGKVEIRKASWLNDVVRNLFCTVCVIFDGKEIPTKRSQSHGQQKTFLKRQGLMLMDNKMAK